MHPLKGLRPLPPSPEERDRGVVRRGECPEYGQVIIHRVLEYSKLWKIVYRVLLATPSASKFIKTVEKQCKSDVYVSVYHHVYKLDDKIIDAVILGTDGFPKLPEDNGGELGKVISIESLVEFLARKRGHEFKYHEEKIVVKSLNKGKSVVIIALPHQYEAFYEQVKDDKPKLRNLVISVTHTILHEMNAHGLSYIMGHHKTGSDDHLLYNGTKSIYSPTIKQIATESKLKKTPTKRDYDEVVAAVKKELSLW